MKTAILITAVIAIGLGAVYGVYHFRETRLTPAELDAMRQAERRLIEAEAAEAAVEDGTAETMAAMRENPHASSVAQAGENPDGATTVWRQIETPEFDPQKSFHVKFACSMGDFVIEFHPEWAPIGAKRVHELVSIDFFDDIRFFRVIDGFMAQFGIPGDPQVAEKWQHANIQDDPVKESNQPGYVTFAKGSMPNSRSTQLFISFGDNSRLDSMGFAPVGQVIDGMDVVNQIYKGYGGGPDDGGRGPRQDMIVAMGNKYLSEQFPQMDYIKKARFVEPVEVAAEPEAEAETENS